MRNILVLTYWSFPEGLIQSYTLPYVRIIKKNLPPGSLIFLLTLEKNGSIMSPENKHAIEKRLINEGIVWLPFTYKSFGLLAFFQWIRIGFRLCVVMIVKKISDIHCWCTPTGAIGYFLSTLFKCNLVIDSYEPHAESMVENGSWKKNGMAFRILYWLEKKQTKRANYLIGTTQGMRQYAFKKYQVDVLNFMVKPACVDLDLFSKKDIKDTHLLEQLRLNDKLVCVYAGKFGGIYLEAEVFEFFKACHDYWGDRFRVLLLTPHNRDEIGNFCNQAGLIPDIVVSLLVDHHVIPKYLDLADFAITPVKPVPSKQFCSPIKDGEYWAMGLPVVIPANISDDAKIIERYGIGAVLNSLTKEEYGQAIEKIDEILKQPKYDMVARIREVARLYRSFEIAEKVYREIYRLS